MCICLVYWFIITWQQRTDEMSLFLLEASIVFPWLGCNSIQGVGIIVRDHQWNLWSLDIWTTIVCAVFEHLGYIKKRGLDLLGFVPEQCRRLVLTRLVVLEKWLGHWAQHNVVNIKDWTSELSMTKSILKELNISSMKYKFLKCITWTYLLYGVSKYERNNPTSMY